MKRDRTEGQVASWLGAAAAFVSRHPRAVLAVAGLLVLLSAALAGTSLRYRTQRGDLMSADRDVQRRWNAFVAEFGPDDDMVVAVEGDDPDRMRQAIDAVAERVSRAPEHFDRLFYRAEADRLAGRALLYLDEDSLRELAQRLDHMDLLLGPVAPLVWRSLTLDGVLIRAEWCAAQLARGEELAPADRQLMEQLGPILDSASATVRDPEDYADPWVGLMPGITADADRAEGGYLLNDDHTLALLLVRPVADEGSFTPDQAPVQRLRAIIAEVAAECPDVEIGLTGLPVLENDEMAASQSDSMRAAWLALLGVILLYAVAYRRRRYPVLTIVTLLTGGVWAVGWLTLTVGHLNILSSAFAVMLIGMGDYGVLWVARYETERSESSTAGEALARTAAHVGPGILTAALTTALAFFATMFADFRAVAELGWIAGCGVLLCALSCFMVMPALLTLCDRRLYSEGPSVVRLEDRRNAGRTWLPGVAARPVWVTCAAVAVVSALGVAALGVGYDHNLLHLQNEDLPSVAWEKRVIERTSGAGWNAVSVAESREEAARLRERYESLPEVGRVVEVASMIPEGQGRKLPILENISKKLSRVPEPGRVTDHDPPRVAMLSRRVGRIAERLRGAAEGAEPDGLSEKLARFDGQLRSAPDGVLVERLSHFESRMSSDLAADLRRLADAATPEPITAAELPDGLRERYTGPDGKWLVRAFAEENVWEYQALSDFVMAVRRVDPEATGKPFGTLEGLRLMKAGFEWAGVYALIAIVAVLAFDFRDARLVTLALVPLAIGAVCCVGLMRLFGLSFNPANLIALPLIVGVGIDHGVHVLHDFRNRRRDRPYALSWPTGRGILIAALTTMLGFGALTLASHRGLSGLGMTLLIGVGCCLASALVVLPAVLRLVGRVESAAEEPGIRRAA